MLHAAKRAMQHRRRQELAAIPTELHAKMDAAGDENPPVRSDTTGDNTTSSSTTGGDTRAEDEAARSDAAEARASLVAQMIEQRLSAYQQRDALQGQLLELSDAMEAQSRAIEALQAQMREVVAALHRLAPPAPAVQADAVTCRTGVTVRCVLVPVSLP